MYRPCGSGHIVILWSLCCSPTWKIACCGCVASTVMSTVGLTPYCWGHTHTDNDEFHLQWEDTGDTRSVTLYTWTNKGGSAQKRETWPVVLETPSFMSNESHLVLMVWTVVIVNALYRTCYDSMMELPYKETLGYFNLDPHYFVSSGDNNFWNWWLSTM